MHFLRLTGLPVAILVDFNVAVLRQGLRRLSYNPHHSFPPSRLHLAIHRIFLLIRGKMFDDSREDRTARAPRTPGFWGSESMIPDLPGGPGVLAVSVLRRNVTNGEMKAAAFMFHFSFGPGTPPSCVARSVSFIEEHVSLLASNCA